MSLSKIYRGAETADLQEFQFRSFGEPEGMAPLESNQSAPHPTSPAPAAKPSTGAANEQQLQDAFARGRQEGLAVAGQRLESATQALTLAVEDLSRLRESLAQSSSQDMLRLVMAVSEQIIRKSLEIDPKLVLGILENALQSSVRADSFRVRINPADLELVTSRKPLFLASISGLKNLSIEADPSISAGGCRVDSELGEVDATLETQLESLHQALSAAIVDG